MTTHKRPKESSYRRAERLREVKWLLDHPYDYTKREIARAKELQRRLERLDRKEAVTASAAGPSIVEERGVKD